MIEEKADGKWAEVVLFYSLYLLFSSFLFPISKHSYEFPRGQCVLQRLRKGKKPWQGEFKEGRRLIHEGFWRNNKVWGQNVAGRQGASSLLNSLLLGHCHRVPTQPWFHLGPCSEGQESHLSPCSGRIQTSNTPSSCSGCIFLRGLKQSHFILNSSKYVPTSELHMISYLETVYSEI